MHVWGGGGGGGGGANVKIGGIQGVGYTHDVYYDNLCMGGGGGGGGKCKNWGYTGGWVHT